MIVAMKKLSIVVRTSWKEDVLNTLSDMEVIHLNHVKRPEGEGINELNDKIHRLEKALAMVDKVPEEKGNETSLNKEDEERALTIADELLSVDTEARHLEEDILLLEEEYSGAAVWGRVDPEDLDCLKDKGIYVKLYKCRRRDLNKIPHSDEVSIIYHKKLAIYLTLISADEKVTLPFEEIPAPEHGTEELGRRMEEKENRLMNLRNKIADLASHKTLLKDELKQLVDMEEFEEARAGMGGDEDVSFLKGFIPLSQVSFVEKISAQKNWAILIEDPSEEDDVPTLIKHSKISRLFQPVMNFIGVVPGYREYDTNIVFFLFFAIFFAMIVGDGGYGVILLIATFVASQVGKGIPRPLKVLFFILSLGTIFWGAITGTWFGIASIGTLPVLGDIIVPSLNSFAKESDDTVIHLCFLIAALHLSIAHIWKGVRDFAFLYALVDMGWLMLIWSLYFFARFLILKEPLNVIALYLLASGFALIVLFAQQKNDGLLKGCVRGLVSAPLAFLDGVGSFSHLVSYIRLFAVGLATKEVAVAFNGLAETIGYDSILSTFGAIAILIAGHTMNVLLAAMAVLVHAVRLNLLEFSAHMSIQWSGEPYRPFQAKKSNSVTVADI
ncbi:MAG: hypothetical protein IME96_00095 [Proteobacteria bacterium]|nr:hypothetical protein [Pseudomonadota bacterium]